MTEAARIHSLVALLLGNALCCSDGSCGTDETAEVTADALGTHDAGQAGGDIEDNGLVAAVHTRDIAAPAAHALVSVYLGINDSLTVQVGRCHEVRQLLTHDVSYLSSDTNSVKK